MELHLKRLLGSISEIAGGNLKTGLLAATIFPIVLVFALVILNKRQNIQKIIN